MSKIFYLINFVLSPMLIWHLNFWKRRREISCTIHNSWQNKTIYVIIPFTLFKVLNIWEVSSWRLPCSKISWNQCHPAITATQRPQWPLRPRPLVISTPPPTSSFHTQRPLAETIWVTPGMTFHVPHFRLTIPPVPHLTKSRIHRHFHCITNLPLWSWR